MGKDSQLRENRENHKSFLLKSFAIYSYQTVHCFSYILPYEVILQDYVL